jgi:5-methylcytosine-specific restriction endonuclease McrA
VLDRKTLVLNRSWTPITLTTVRRAVVLLAAGAARVVHPATYEVADWDGWLECGPIAAGAVKGANFELPVPEVIVLQRYNGFPDRPVAFTRRNVYRRDGHACVYCGATPPQIKLTIDHVNPRARGGETSWENCVTACITCNSKKADRLPQEAGYRLPGKPSAPRWPGGIDPAMLRDRPVWDRFLPAAHRAVLDLA